MDRILIVEDDFIIADYLRGLCEGFGMRVVGSAMDAATALRLTEELRPDSVLMDVRLRGERDGVEVAMAIHDSHPETRVIFVTGSSEPSTLRRIRSDRPHRILIKPIDPAELEEALQERPAGGAPSVVPPP